MNAKFDGCPDTEMPWGEICRTCGRRLPKPLPWEHGRPCSRESDLRRYTGAAPVEHRAAHAWGVGR